jgi:hypothetical protein
MLRFFLLLCMTGSLLFSQNQSDEECMEKISVRFITDTKTYWYGIGDSSYKRRDKSDSFSKASSIALQDIALSMSNDFVNSIEDDSFERISDNGIELIETFKVSNRSKTAVFFKDSEIIHKERCSKRAYVVRRLNKISFIQKQPKILKDYLSSSESLLSSDLSTLNRLINIDNNHNQLSIAKNFLILDPKNNLDLSKQSSDMILRLEKEYERLIKDINIDFTLSSPLMSSTMNPLQLIIKVYDKKTKIGIPNMPIKFSLGTSNYIFDELSFITDEEVDFIKNENNLVSNANGIVRINIDPRIKDFTPLTYNATVDIVPMLKNHNLFKKYPSSNPDYNYTLETVPLVIKQNVILDNEFLQGKLKSTNIKLQRMIQDKVQVDFADNNPVYILELRYYDISQYVASNGQYIIKFSASASLINKKNNVISFQFDFPNQKGLSWIGYDRAFNIINDSMNKHIQEVSNGIIKAII